MTKLQPNASTHLEVLLVPATMASVEMDFLVKVSILSISVNAHNQALTFLHITSVQILMNVLTQN